MDGNLTEIILFYFFRLFCFGFLAFYYFCFRGAIEDRLIRQRKLSYVKLYELKKGIKNYWFFENIHKQVNLGFWYRFNFLYIILYALFLLPLIFLGFIPIIAKFISFASLILYPMALVMFIFWCIEHNISTHKKIFVVNRRY